MRTLYHHPLDPPGAHDAALHLVPLVADDRMTLPMAVDAVLCAHPPRNDIHRSGLQARLSHWLGDAVDDLIARRMRVERLIRKMAWTEMDKHADPDVILRRAEIINQANGSPWEAPRAFVHFFIGQWLKVQRQRRAKR